MFLEPFGDSGLARGWGKMGQLMLWVFSPELA